MYEQTQIVFKATLQKYYVVVNFRRNNAGITTRILVKKIPNISRHDKVVICKLQQSKMLLPLDINFLDLLRTIVSLDLFIIDGDQKVVKFHSSLETYIYIIEQQIHRICSLSFGSSELLTSKDNDLAYKYIHNIHVTKKPVKNDWILARLMPRVERCEMRKTQEQVIFSRAA